MELGVQRLGWYFEKGPSRVLKVKIEKSGNPLAARIGDGGICDQV